MDAGRGVVVKRFRSRARREPVREWTALVLLAEFAPGLAAAPVRADLGGPAHDRNPAGTLERQAARLLLLLGRQLA